MNQDIASVLEHRKIKNTSWSISCKHGFFLKTTLVRFLKMLFFPLRVMKKALKKKRREILMREDGMIGPKEKGLSKDDVSPPLEDFKMLESIDIRRLPRYISYRAALLREKLQLQYVVLILSSLFAVYFAVSRYEVMRLYERLREKEYILAPGVMDFIPASPEMVPDSYIKNAVVEFSSLLTTVTPQGIDEGYEALANSMSRELKVSFEEEAAEWKKRIKVEGLSELFSPLEKEITSDGKGSYEALVIGRVDSYAGGSHIGFRDEVIEIQLKLVPPRTGKRWYLEMTRLSRSNLDNFKRRKSFGNSKENSEGGKL